ncbi:hypothetical protein Esti_000001 [Eimeria stiedai]
MIGTQPLRRSRCEGERICKGPNGGSFGGPYGRFSDLHQQGPSDYFSHDSRLAPRSSSHQHSPPLRRRRDGPPGGPRCVKRYGESLPREQQMRRSDGIEAVSPTTSSLYSSRQTVGYMKSSSSKWQQGSSKARGGDEESWKSTDENSSRFSTWDLIDASRSTTRSSSGSRCLATLRKNSNNGWGESDPTPKLECPPETKESEGEEKARVVHAAAAAAAAAPAAALSLGGVLEEAAADIEGMTESEVRIYALQMQALTQVLLRNMSCLYTTARAEIDRKDQRLAQQESEIISLKRILTQHKINV